MKRVIHLGRVTAHDDRTPDHRQAVREGTMRNLLARDETGKLCIIAGYKEQDDALHQDRT